MNLGHTLPDTDNGKGRDVSDSYLRGWGGEHERLEKHSYRSLPERNHNETLERV